LNAAWFRSANRFQHQLGLVIQDVPVIRAKHNECQFHQLQDLSKRQILVACNHDGKTCALRRP